jgi:hypothetical protein
LLSILLALASLPHHATAHSAHSNDGLSAVTYHLDEGSNDGGSRSGHCVSVLSCLSCLPAPEQVLHASATGATVEFTRIPAHLGPTLEQALPPPRLSSQV